MKKILTVVFILTSVISVSFAQDVFKHVNATGTYQLTYTQLKNDTSRPTGDWDKTTWDVSLHGRSCVGVMGGIRVDFPHLWPRASYFQSYYAGLTFRFIQPVIGFEGLYGRGWSSDVEFGAGYYHSLSLTGVHYYYGPSTPIQYWEKSLTMDGAIIKARFNWFIDQPKRRFLTGHELKFSGIVPIQKNFQVRLNDQLISERPITSGDNPGFTYTASYDLSLYSAPIRNELYGVTPFLGVTYSKVNHLNEPVGEFRAGFNVDYYNKAARLLSVYFVYMDHAEFTSIGAGISGDPFEAVRFLFPRFACRLSHCQD